jgi:hypothetical protein
MLTDIKVWDVEDDVEEGEGCTGIVYDLICEPQVFGTCDFDLFLVWVFFPSKQKDESMDGSSLVMPT